MKSIKLTCGHVARVSDQDYLALSKYRWYARKGPGRTVYAYRPKGGGIVFMHREILNPPDGSVVDHANGDGLDNRRSNIRVCTHAQNMKNRQQNRNKRTSRFKGVWLDKNGRYRVRIRSDGVDINLGAYDAEATAAKQYDRAARLFHGEFARTNEDLNLY